MSNIVLKKNQVNNSVIPYLQDAISKLNSAYNKLNQLDIPSDFNQKTYLHNVKNNIDGMRKKLTGYTNNIKNLVIKINNIENKNQNFSNVNNIYKTKTINTTTKSNNFIKPSLVSDEFVNRTFDNPYFQKDTMESIKKDQKKANIKKFINSSSQIMTNATTEAFKDLNEERENKVLKYAKSGWNTILTNPGKAINNLGTAGSWAWNGKGGLKQAWTNPMVMLSDLGIAGAAFTFGLAKGIESFGDGLLKLGSLPVKGYLTYWDWATGDKNYTASTNYSNTINKVVSYDSTKMYEDAYFSNASVKVMEEKSGVKRDSTFYNISKQFGRVSANIILLTGASVATTASVSTAAAFVSGVSSYGENYETELNKNALKLKYGDNDLSLIIDYNALQKIKELKIGSSTTITQSFQTSDGKSTKLVFTIKSLGNGKYDITDQDGHKFEFNGFDEVDINKAELKSLLKGTRDGVLYYLGAKVNEAQFESIVGGISNPVLKTAAQSGMRIMLDTASGAVVTPTDALITMGVDGKSWEEAWEESGGNAAMLSNIVMGAAFSSLSEIGNITSSFKGTKVASRINKEGFTAKNLDDISKLKGYELKSYIEKSIKDGTFEETFKFINKQELDNISKMFNKTDLQKITDTKLDYKIHIEDNILTSNLQNKITQEQLEYMKNLKGDDLEAFMMKASQVGKLKDVMNYLDQKEIKKISPKNKNIKLDDELNIKNSGESPKTKLNKNYIKKFLEKSDFNKKNLVEGIIKQLPDNLDDVTKARLIYLKLNQAVSYSDQYTSSNLYGNSNSKFKSEIYNQKFDITNLNSNNVVCSNWSDIYHDLLIASGISESRITIMGSNSAGSHHWVCVDMGNNKLLMADATNRYGDLTDLTASKINMDTNGFFVIDKSSWENYLNEFKDYNNSSYYAMKKAGFEHKDSTLKIDKTIGYGKDKTSKYLKKIEKLNDAYNKVDSKISSNEKIDTLMKIFDGDMSVIDAYGGLKKYIKSIMGQTGGVSLFYNGEDLKLVISYMDEQKNIVYMIKEGNSNFVKCSETDVKTLEKTYKRYTKG